MGSAEAAVLAAELRLDEAADRAAWAAGVAADQRTWTSCCGLPRRRPVRSGAARAAAAGRPRPGRRPLAACYVEHVAALAAGDPVGLDAAANGFQHFGLLLFAAEAAAARRCARRRGDRRAAPASAQRAAGYRAACESAVSPWLAAPPPRSR